VSDPHRPVAPAARALTARGIGAFGAPLAANALLLALAGPLLNIIVVRAAAPTVELAAFWLAFSVTLLVASASQSVQPLTVMALRRGPGLRPAARVALATGLLSGAAVVVLSAGGDALFGGLIPTSPRVARRAAEVLVVLAALPALVAARGAALGVATASGGTALVLGAALVRMAMLGAVAGGVLAGGSAGALDAAVTLVAATAAETLVAVAGTWRAWRVGLRTGWSGSPRAHAALLRTGVPLVVSAAAWAATRPVVGAVLGRLDDPELAQAAFGALLPVLFLGCAPLWVLQDVCLVLPGDRAELRTTLKVAAGAAAASALMMAAWVVVPAPGAWARVDGPHGPALRDAVMPALGWMVLMPFPLAARAVAQGMLLRAGRGGPWLVVAPLRLALMAGAGLAVAAWWPDAPGALVAVGLLLGGDVLDALASGFAARGVLDRGQVYAPADTRGEVAPAA
jgi:hypothetical protein